MLRPMSDDVEDLARLADQLVLGLLSVGDDLTIGRANLAAHTLLGRHRGALVGRSVMEAFIDHHVEEVLAGSVGGVPGQMEIDAPDERRLVLRSRRAASGGAWVLLEDVTELRRLQRIRAEFIDNLSHELRTPLTTIRLLTERLLAELDGLDVPPRVRERVATIDVETGHLVQMVNELLDLSRIEQAATQLHLDVVPVGPLVEGAVARLATFAERQAVDLVTSLPADPWLPPVRGDADRLGQVLVNLLHNAVKFSPAGRRVTVSAEPVSAEVVVSVADEGPGIPKGDQNRVFERFYKVDRARPRTGGGTGLGLAIARHIVSAHGGRIWVESEEGQGATFRVALPAVLEA
jgi:two-component system phosphate regulon sensor histidine kinase PhoR